MNFEFKELAFKNNILTEKEIEYSNKKLEKAVEELPPEEERVTIENYQEKIKTSYGQNRSKKEKKYGFISWIENLKFTNLVYRKNLLE